MYIYMQTHRSVIAALPSEPPRRRQAVSGRPETGFMLFMYFV